MSDLSRREAMILASACACCAMSGEVDAADPPAAKAKSVVLGKLADYTKPGFYDKFAKQKVLVARLDDRLVAMSNVCTHKSCSVRINADDKTLLKCPCHDAEYSAYGTPTDGPAKTALSRYAVKQSANGTITADLTKSFIESKWDDAAAFIPLTPKLAAE